jgi:hypothetical protein
MRLKAEISIMDDDYERYETVWFGVMIILLWWKLSFRVSREQTAGHLGSEGRPLIRFFLGSTNYHICMYPTSYIAEPKTVYRWRYRFGK